MSVSSCPFILTIVVGSGPGGPSRERAAMSGSN